MNQISPVRENLNPVLELIIKKTEEKGNYGLSSYPCFSQFLDEVTHNHMISVSNGTYKLCKRLSVTGESLISTVLGAYLHDIGKFGISKDILHKPGKLTIHEFDLMKDHTIIGKEIIEKYFSWIPQNFHIAQIAHQHHEKGDGSGYPNGLKLKDICIEAQIVTVVDIVEAMTARRGYQNKEIKFGDIEEVLIEGRDLKQLNGLSVRYMIELMKEYNNTPEKIRGIFLPN